MAATIQRPEQDAIAAAALTAHKAAVDGVHGLPQGIVVGESIRRSADGWEAIELATGADLASLGEAVDLKADLSALDDLSVVVVGKAEATDVDDLAAIVVGKADASDLADLSTEVEGKAEIATVTALGGRVGRVDQGTDWTDGENVVMYAGAVTGRKGHLRDGSTAAPVTTSGPSFKVSRKEALTVGTIEAAGGVGTDGADQVAAIAGLSQGGEASETQTVGLYGAAKNGSNSETGNPDASGGYFIGRVTGGTSSKATAIGATIVGRRDVDTADISGAEISANNATLVAGTYSSTGASKTRVLWLYASGTADGGAIVNIGNPFGRKAEVAIGIPNQNGGAASNSTFRDDGEAKRSIDIRGKHSEGAIIVGAESGAVILGASALTTTTTQKLEINVGSTASMPALRLQANANTSLGIRMNNTSANFDIGQAGAADQLMLNTVGGDGVIIVGNSSTLHIGRSAAVAVLKVGSGIGFYGKAPVARSEAYAQTYAAATRTHNNVTSEAVATTGSTNSTPFGYTTGAQANAIPTAINALRVDLGNVKQLVNSVIDDLQANGLFQ